MIIALLIVVPVGGFFLFSGNEANEKVVSEGTASVTSSTTKSDMNKKSNVDVIAAYDAGLANKIQRDKVISKLRALKTSLYMYGVDGAEPPSNEEGLQALVDKGFLQQQQIIDEWGNKFVYRLEWGKDDGFWKEYKIYVHSKGPDGISGNGDDISMF